MQHEQDWTGAIYRTVTARFFHRSVCIATGFGALLATSFAFHSLLPPSIPEGVAEKLEFFTRHKDEFDTIFLGTSRFYYAVSPKIFDNITRENGVPTQTFNFGVDGMHPPESFYVLEQILKTEPRKLKWVFLEVGNIQTHSTADVFGTERFLYWHDWPRTALVLNKVIDPAGRAEWYVKLIRALRKQRELVLHLGLFEKQFANVGRVADFLASQTNVQPVEASPKLGPKGDGHQLMERPPMSLERAERYRRKLTEEVFAARPKLIDPYAEMAYRDYADKIRRLGASPVFVVTPDVFQSPLLFRKPAPPGPLLPFNDSRKYPQLYDAAMRVDNAHLTNEGAEEFTRLVALEFLRYARPP
ncbi:MAG TPA: hypothetical protein VGW39_09970 [Chthoniobacterales bacterium]|nr:hypothetical protein [Chthoniobacterales bacterium]